VSYDLLNFFTIFFVQASAKSRRTYISARLEYLFFITKVLVASARMATSSMILASHAFWSSSFSRSKAAIFSSSSDVRELGEASAQTWRAAHWAAIKDFSTRSCTY
jgi:hypothetical protein